MVQCCNKYLLGLALVLTLSACHDQPQDRGQQYKDGKLTRLLVGVKQPNINVKPINDSDYLNQLIEIGNVSPALYGRNSSTYDAMTKWLSDGAEVSKLANYNLSIYQMQGTDGFGNVRFTGYYTPVIEARRQAGGEFKYPLYGMPQKKRHQRLPERAEIHAGALDNQGLELAYTQSLVDNFMMGVQGSAYINFSNGEPLNFFAYAGKNGHAYRSIGAVLIDRNEVLREEMSMQAIRKWCADNSDDKVLELLGQNPSFVFFIPKGAEPVKGASGIPLIAKASVAADSKLIPPGTTLLAEVPQLDKNGQFNGKYQLRLMVALDVGGAIKGNHFDIYQGIGKEAGEAAGQYNHFGRVWLLSTPTDAMSALLASNAV